MPIIAARHLAAALSVAAMLAAGGCASPPQGAVRQAPPSSWMDIGTDEVRMDFQAAEAPTVIAARRRWEGPTGYREEAVLANDTVTARENRWAVQIQLESRSLSAALGMRPTGSVVERYDEDRLRALLRTEFPTARVAVGDVVRTNRYGSYGYAVAADPAGVTCVFTWQVLEDDAEALPVGVAAASLQFRYCDPARSVGELLALFESLRLRFDGLRVPS